MGATKTVRIAVPTIALGLCAGAAHATIEDIAGSYTGTWNNLTFSSMGPAMLDIAIDGDAVTAEVDMGGGVFGQLDPDGDGVTITGSVVGGNAVFDDTVMTYGRVMGTVSGTDGSVDFTLTMIPGFMSIEATGSIAGGVVDLAYLVNFMGGGMANGELDAMTLPEPDAWASSAGAILALLALARRRARPRDREGSQRASWKMMPSV